MPNNLLQAAIWYVKHGYRIFPLAPGTKIPMQGSRGFLDATNDPATIESWWATNPDANIGLATAGLCVIDFDVDKATGKQAAWIETEGVRQAVLESPMRQRTPSGGLHVMFKQPTNANWRISASVLADHVDVRADGGYIVAATSQINGADY